MNYVIIFTIIIITAIDWLHALDFIIVEVIVFGDQAFFAHIIFIRIHCILRCSLSIPLDIYLRWNF